MAALQGISLPGGRLALESLTQALILPPLWIMAFVLRGKMVPHAQN